jgi:hypothetical protein
MGRFDKRFWDGKQLTKEKKEKSGERIETTQAENPSQRGGYRADGDNFGT